MWRTDTTVSLSVWQDHAARAGWALVSISDDRATALFECLYGHTIIQTLARRSGECRACLLHRKLNPIFSVCDPPPAIAEGLRTTAVRHGMPLHWCPDCPTRCLMAKNEIEMLLRALHYTNLDPTKAIDHQAPCWYMCSKDHSFQLSEQDLRCGQRCPFCATAK